MLLWYVLLTHWKVSVRPVKHHLVVFSATMVEHKNKQKPKLISLDNEDEEMSQMITQQSMKNLQC